MICGLLADGEWRSFEAFLVSANPLGVRPARGHQRVLDAVFWIARTNAPWRDPSAGPGDWSPVFRQFRRWTASGLRDVMLEVLADGGDDADLLRMIDCTSVWGHDCAAGGMAGLIEQVRSACEVASRASSASAAMCTACPSLCV